MPAARLGVLSTMRQSVLRLSVLRLSAMGVLVIGIMVASPQTAAAKPQAVPFDPQYERGAIIIKTGERRLYYVTDRGEALEYQVAVGSPRNQWFGQSFVSKKRVDPVWRPTPDMRRRNPRLPKKVAAGPSNPLGVRALNLDWGAYRIHGTNNPGSIGRAVSNGCIRMRNEDVIDLFDRTHIGAPVYVLR